MLQSLFLSLEKTEIMRISRNQKMIESGQCRDCVSFAISILSNSRTLNGSVQSVRWHFAIWTEVKSSLALKHLSSTDPYRGCGLMKRTLAQFVMQDHLKLYECTPCPPQDRTHPAVPAEGASAQSTRGGTAAKRKRSNIVGVSQCLV